MKTADYLKQIQRYNVRRAWPTPEKTALLVIDMQNYFDSLSVAILPNILNVIKLCRLRGIKTRFTRHGHRNPKKDGGMLAKWWGDVIQYGSPGWQLQKSIVAESSEIVDKNRYSAFFDTGLHEMLQDVQIEDLIITGVMTNCCCETTARDAFMHDYRVFFVADATATANEELHIASLKNLAYAFAHIVTTQELCAVLEKSTGN